MIRPASILSHSFHFCARLRIRVTRTTAVFLEDAQGEGNKYPATNGYSIEYFRVEFTPIPFARGTHSSMYM